MPRRDRPNTKKNMPGCFIRKARPKRIPEKKTALFFLFSVSRAWRRASVPPSAKRTTKCVA